MTPLIWNENREAGPAGRLLGCGVLAGDAAPRRKHVSHRARRGFTGGATRPRREEAPELVSASPLAANIDEARVEDRRQNAAQR